MTAQTTKNILKIVAKNAAIGNFSDLFVAKTAMLARVFKEKRIKVTIIYNVLNIFSFRLKNSITKDRHWQENLQLLLELEEDQ
jgi:hypothetical protein